jgi:hypothetical protein
MTRVTAGRIDWVGVRPTDRVDILRRCRAVKVDEALDLAATEEIAAGEAARGRMRDARGNARALVVHAEKSFGQDSVASVNLADGTVAVEYLYPMGSDALSLVLTRRAWDFMERVFADGGLPVTRALVRARDLDTGAALSELCMTVQTARKQDWRHPPKPMQRLDVFRQCDPFSMPVRDRWKAKDSAR